MAIVSTHGAERSLSGGRILRLISRQSINLVQSLFAGDGTDGYRIVGGELDISGAAAVELKVGSVSKYYRKFGSAFVIGFDDEAEIGCGPDETLNIEADAAVDVDGYLILTPRRS